MLVTGGYLVILANLFAIDWLDCRAFKKRFLCDAISGVSCMLQKTWFRPFHLSQKRQWYDDGCDLNWRSLDWIQICFCGFCRLPKWFQMECVFWKRSFPWKPISSRGLTKRGPNVGKTCVAANSVNIFVLPNSWYCHELSYKYLLYNYRCNSV